MNAHARHGTRQNIEIGTVAASDDYQDGFTTRTKLGRVDDAHAHCDDGTLEARVAIQNDNELLITLFNQDGSGEVNNGTDQSAVNVTYTAIQQ